MSDNPNTDNPHLFDYDLGNVNMVKDEFEKRRAAAREKQQAQTLDDKSRNPQNDDTQEIQIGLTAEEQEILKQVMTEFADPSQASESVREGIKQDSRRSLTSEESQAVMAAIRKQLDKDEKDKTKAEAAPASTAVKESKPSATTPKSEVTAPKSVAGERFFNQDTHIIKWAENPELKEARDELLESIKLKKQLLGEDFDVATYQDQYQLSEHAKLTKKGEGKSVIWVLTHTDEQRFQKIDKNRGFFQPKLYLPNTVQISHGMEIESNGVKYKFLFTQNRNILVVGTQKS